MARRELPEGVSLQDLLESIRNGHEWLMERVADKSLIRRIEEVLKKVEIVQSHDLPEAAHNRLEQIEMDLEDLKGRCEKAENPKTNNTEAAA